VDEGMIFQPDASWAAAGNKLWTSYPVPMGEEPMLGFNQFSLDNHTEFSEATTEAEVDTLSIPDPIDAESIDDEGTSYDYYNSYEHENEDNNSDACSDDWLDFRQIDNEVSSRASEAEDTV
jgi:hypothetical protein